MAKNKNILIALFWILSVAGIHGQSTVNNLRQNLIDTALSQVGVREATGHNDGVAVEKYLHLVGFGKGAPWCAAFLSWDYYVNGTDAIKTAWAPNWFPTSNVILKAGIIKQAPQPGDIFGLFIDGRIGHVGMVYKWNENIVTTIEGNTNMAGSREGDGVYIKKRLRRQIYAASCWIK